MSQFNLPVNGVSMTTVEISELTGKRHDHVLRDTRYMLLELYGENALPKFGERYKAADNNIHPCYRLPKKEVLVLVSGYSIKLRMAIITRLEELEQVRDKKTSLPDFTNPAEAARAFADQWEQRSIAEKKAEQLEIINQKNTPKVESFDCFLNSDGLYTLRSAFKALGLPPNTYTKRLREDKVLYYLQGQNSPMEDYKKRGYFVVNASLNTNKDKSYPQTFVTPKGLDWLRKRYCDAAGKNTAT